MKKVYEPSEDTYLLIDSLAKLRGRFDKAADIGSGSGETSISLAGMTDEIYAIDIMIEAARETWNKLKRAGLAYRSHVIRGDSLTAFRRAKLFDLVISNPPYLEPSGLRDEAIEGGLSFLERLLEESAIRLKPAGRILIIVSCIDTDRFMIQKKLRELGLSFRLIGSRRIFFEELLAFECFFKEAQNSSSSSSHSSSSSSSNSSHSSSSSSAL